MFSNGCLSAFLKFILQDCFNVRFNYISLYKPLNWLLSQITFNFASVNKVFSVFWIKGKAVEQEVISDVVRSYRENHRKFEMLCAIWYYLYNLKNVQNTRGRVLILVKLQATASTFAKSNMPLWVFFTFFKLYKSY